MGGIQETADGLVIQGGRQSYHGAVCESYHDHRIAMASALMGLVSKGETIVHDAECINISFPVLHTCWLNWEEEKDAEILDRRESHGPALTAVVKAYRRDWN